MEPIQKPDLEARPRKRLLRRFLLVLVLLLIGLVAALPWYLSSERGRVWLLTKANAALSPGRLEVDSFAFSWFQPTEMKGLRIIDPKGKRVLDSQVVHWSRNLFGILFGKPRYGTLRLEQTVLDVERHQDGSVDIEQALDRILVGTPGTDFTVELVGRVTLRSSVLTKPIQSEHFDLRIHRPAAPAELTWKAIFEGSDQTNRLVLSGLYNKWDGLAPNLHRMRIAVDARNWPFAIQHDGIEAEIRLSGDLFVERLADGWRTRSGIKDDVVLSECSVFGPKLNGDRVDLADVLIQWNYEKTVSPGGPPAMLGDKADDSAEAQVLRIKSKLFELVMTNLADSSPGLEGKLDLAAIASALPKTLHLRDNLVIDRGTASLSVVPKLVGGSQAWAAVAKIEGLRGRYDQTNVTQHDPASLKAEFSQQTDGMTLDSLAIDSSFFHAKGQGNLNSGIAVTGSLDLGAMAVQLADFVDFGNQTLAGKGTFKADVNSDAQGVIAKAQTSFDTIRIGPKDDPLLVGGLTFAATGKGPRTLPNSDWRWEGSAALGGLTRFGLELGPTRVSMKQSRDGSLVVDTFDGTLNGGKLHLVPVVTLGKEPMLRLLPGSSLINAEVNEEMSRRVLTFAAPILDGTRLAKGRISARIESAEIPLSRDAKTKTQVEGTVVFQDLAFEPGPMAADLLALTGSHEPMLRLDQPVVLSIADSRIHQSGLAIPVGKLTRIEIEGDVGFDKSLDLMASVPFTSEMFPNGGILGDLVKGSQINVPITGTLDQPKIDREEFRAQLGQMGKQIGSRAATRAAAELLFRMTRPRDPNAPPPLTPAERKALRQQKKLEKRGVF